MDDDFEIPAVFTPENEPYLGLKSVLWYDPIGSYHNLVHLGDNTVGYASGRVLNNPEFCDGIAMEAQSYLVVLAAKMSKIFPEVDIPDMDTYDDM